MVDLAAEQGGNCDLTEAGKLLTVHWVRIVGYTDFQPNGNTKPYVYATNIRHMLDDLTPEKDGALNVNMDDDVTAARLSVMMVRSPSCRWSPKFRRSANRTPTKDVNWRRGKST